MENRLWPQGGIPGRAQVVESVALIFAVFVRLWLEVPDHLPPTGTM
jgi:hypothetical protein